LNISPEKMPTPAILVLAGCSLLIVGAVGTWPFGTSPSTIESSVRIILLILGSTLVIIGLILAWREVSVNHRTALSLQPKDARIISTEIAKQVRIELASKLQRPSRSKSLFEERISHFHAEKQHLAEHFSIPLLQRCERYVQEGKQVHLLIDSGTTLYPLFERIGEATVRAHESRDNWLNNFWLETNNIPGVLMLMDTGRINPNNRYSPLAVNCDLLPGIPLPVYSALTGKKTIAALGQLRAEADKDAIFIAVTTGNWIRLRRSIPVCPVPLARGLGHLEFKQALMDFADEVYVISPLGKIFLGVPLEDVNLALGFDTKRNDPDRQPYHEVRISDEMARHVKVVTTSRQSGCVLSEHSTRVSTLLGVHSTDTNISLQKFPTRPIDEMLDIMIPFDNLPSDWYLQIETEFPHSQTRNDRLMQKFFSVTTPPRRHPEKRKY
jgi:hypothetical protein